MNYKYSEERRNDPAIRAKVEQVVAARKNALARVAELLREAKETLEPLTQFADDALFNRQVETVWEASHHIARDTRIIESVGTPTYIGNLAAGPLGERIQKMGDSFPAL